MQEFDIADTWIGPGRYYLAVAKNSGAAGNIHNHYWSAATPQGMWAAFGVSMMAAAFPSLLDSRSQPWATTIAHHWAYDGPLVGGVRNWANRIKLTLDYTKLGNHTDFPALVYLAADSNGGDTSYIFDVLGANRKKIAITTSDENTQCYVEIVKWDNVNRQAWLNVKVPATSETTDTILWLYFDPAQPDNTTYVGDVGSVPGRSVWDANFVGVWHLIEQGNGTTNEFKDSTVGAHHGKGIVLDAIRDISS